MLRFAHMQMEHEDDSESDIIPDENNFLSYTTYRLDLSQFSRGDIVSI